MLSARVSLLAKSLENSLVLTRPLAKTTANKRTTSQTVKTVPVPSTGFFTPPFALFVKDNASKLRSGITKEQRYEEMRKLGVAWKRLGTTGQQTYKNKSAKEREEKIAQFQSLPAKEKEAKIAESSEIRKERSKRRVRKERREFREVNGAPKRPPTSFALFVQDQFAALKNAGKPTTPVAEKLVEIKRQWVNLDSTRKEKYLSRAKASLEQYKKEVDEWKKKLAANKPVKKAAKTT